MDVHSETRSGWVKAALFLQGVVFLISVWSCLQLLRLWTVYAQWAEHSLILLLVRSTAEAVAAGIAFWGLWRSKRWGWILAVLTDATFCLFTLSNLIENSTAFLRHPRWLAFSVWDFAAIAVLLYRPVREFFLGKRDLTEHVPAPETVHAAKARAYPSLAPQARPAKEINWAERCARIFCYFLVAVIVVCVVTAFSVTLMMGEKAEGAKGFLFLCVVGFVFGAVPTLFFVLLLTTAARFFGPGKLGVWLAAALVLAPGLTLAMGGLGPRMAGTAGYRQGIIEILFFGPRYLVQAWWLSIPIGLIAAFVCFEMFPWAFGKVDGPARPLRMQN